MVVYSSLKHCLEGQIDLPSACILRHLLGYSTVALHSIFKGSSIGLLRLLHYICLLSSHTLPPTIIEADQDPLLEENGLRGACVPLP